MRESTASESTADGGAHAEELDALLDVVELHLDRRLEPRLQSHLLLRGARAEVLQLVEVHILPPAS